MLCTIDDIKERLGLADSDTAHDAVLERIIKGFSARAAGVCQRRLIAPAAAVTEYYTARARALQLRAYPVITITSVKESLDGSFEEVDPQTEGTDYRLLNPGSDNRGVLVRLWGSWTPAYDGVQVVYRAGFCAAGVTPESGEYALPDDLREAAIMQCSFVYKRKDDIGLSGVSFNGGSFSKFENLKLLPEVVDILNMYKRVVL